MSSNTQSQHRTLTSHELATCIRLLREGRQWSQEQLAQISGLSARTIQRVEQGNEASVHTRRALGAAFGLDDIDWFNKPLPIPTESEIRAANEKFSAEHVTLPALALEGGRQLAQLAEACDMTFCEPGFELSRGAAEAFALMVDYIRDYGDCASLYSEVQKLDVYDELQSYIDALRGLGVSLRYAERRMQIKWSADAANSNPTPVTTLYLLAFPIGNEPDQFAMPKAGPVGI